MCGRGRRERSGADNMLKILLVVNEREGGGGCLHNTYIHPRVVFNVYLNTLNRARIEFFETYFILTAGGGVVPPA